MHMHMTNKIVYLHYMNLQKTKKRRFSKSEVYKYINKSDLTDNYFNLLIQPFITKNVDINANQYDLLLLKFHVDAMGFSLYGLDYLEIAFHKRYTEDINLMYKTLNESFLPHLIKHGNNKADVVEKYKNFIGTFTFSSKNISIVLDHAAKSVNNFVVSDKSNQHSCFLYKTWLKQLMNTFSDTNSFVNDLDNESVHSDDDAKTVIDEDNLSINSGSTINHEMKPEIPVKDSTRMTDQVRAGTIPDESTLNPFHHESELDEIDTLMNFDLDQEIVSFNPINYLTKSIFMPTLDNWNLMLLCMDNEVVAPAFGSFHLNIYKLKEIIYEFVVAALGIISVDKINNIFRLLSKTNYTKFKIPRKAVIAINSHGCILVKNKAGVKRVVPDGMTITKINAVPAGLCEMSNSKKKLEILNKMTGYLMEIHYDMEMFNICDLFNNLNKFHAEFHTKINEIYPGNIHTEKICDAIKKNKSFKQVIMNSGETILNKKYKTDTKPFYEMLIMNSEDGENVEDQLNLFDLFGRQTLEFDEIIDFLKKNGAEDVYIFDFSCNTYCGDVKELDENSEIYKEINALKYGGGSRGGGSRKMSMSGRLRRITKKI